MGLFRRYLVASAVITLATAAWAQPQDSITELLERTSTPPVAQRPNLSAAEKSAVQAAIAAARRSDRGQFDAAYAQIEDIDARRLAMWALVDVMGDDMSFFELDRARRDLAGWPRGEWRQQVTEKELEYSGFSPQQTIDFFGPDKPVTAEGAMALAAAYQSLGRNDEARGLIVHFWRDVVFEADVQSRFFSRFGGMLSADDHIRRADMLLYGPQGPAAQTVVAMLPPAEKALAEARIALRRGVGDPSGVVDRVPAQYRNHGGLVFEQVARARRDSRISTAFALAAGLPPAPGYNDGDQRLWSERRNLFVDAMQAQNYQAAFDSMKDHGFGPGVRKAESDFFAGWVALTKLGDPQTAMRYFQGISEAGTTPITVSRALYWQGRAAEAMGDTEKAQQLYAQGGRYIGAFYGHLAAEKAGVQTLVLPEEPVPTEADRARFEGRPQVRAARILGEIGEADLFKVFVGAIDDNLPSAEEYALLMDLAREYDQPFQAMMTGRAAAGRGFLLPDRMYPIVSPPDVPGAPEDAFVLAITRQESSFDPKIRSSADARGMMMLLPSTARGVAGRMGMPWREAGLWEMDYNMRLGTYHLGELMNQQSGSFILTAVGYNAGPARPPQWTAYCGDPRGASTDPLDFIECVPFTETRDYMMRVMENVQIYRARLNGGSAPLTPSLDLKRGAYGLVAGN